MGKIKWKKIIITGVVILILSAVFTVDDLTVIGETLDPAEFILTGLIGYLLNKFIK